MNNSEILKEEEISLIFTNFEVIMSFFVTVGPTQVEILNRREPLSAGKRYEVKCQSIGARPPPTVTWWLGGKQVKSEP